MPAEVPLTPRAAERLGREAAVQPFDQAARALEIDWGMTMLWHGKVEAVIEALTAESQRLGPPRDDDPPQHPRRVLAQNAGYFTKHKEHMRYPEYRAKGWPIGSGVTEAAVKQFNKRVKGTEQFWLQDRAEPILMLRSLWISQDQRWDTFWINRPAYVN